jgi:hypothetical protein
MTFPPLPHSRILIQPALSLVILTWSLVSSLLAAPSITDLSVRGLHIGGTTVITIRGQDLHPDSRLILPVPIARQQLRPGSTTEALELEVEIGVDAVPGIVPLRIHNSAGLSNSVAVGVDRLSEQPFTADLATLPVALHGTVRGTEILQTRFRGRRGMRITAEVEARRLGSQLRPVLRILDSQGRQLEWNQGIDLLQGDARCTVTLPADGEYQVQLHDLLYRGADPSYFRLKIGNFDFADQVFPTGIQRGATGTFQLAAGGKYFTSTRVTAGETEPGSWLSVVPRSPWFSGIPPRVAVNDHPELVEIGSASPLTLDEIPIAISGRLATPGESDLYLLDVAPGMSLRCELWAQRLGSAIDGVLLIQTEDGRQLARGDDQATTTDPRVDFEVPEGVTRVRLIIQDLIGRGSESSIYRLAVQDLSHPHVTLALDTDRLNISGESGTLVRVVAQRHRYQGPLDLELAGLPEGVHISGARIPAGSDQALLTLHTPPGMDSVSQLAVTGTAIEGEVSLRAVALAPEQIESRAQPWYRQAVPTAVVPSGPIRLLWKNEDLRLIRGGRLWGNLHLERADGVSGKVRLRLLTSQPMPRKKIKENNQEKEVDDLERALRLVDNHVLEADESHVVAHVEVPVDLPDVEWALVFAADLLAEDGETVLATAFTEARFFHPETAFTVTLSETMLTVPAGAMEPPALAGTIERWEHCRFPVTLRLEGLPEGLSVPKVTVPAEEASFRFPVPIAEGTAEMELKDLRLVATAQLTPSGASPPPDAPTISVHTPPLPLSLRITN